MTGRYIRHIFNLFNFKYDISYYYLSKSVIMFIIVGIYILILTASSTQYDPINKRQYGLSIGDPAGNLRIQAFYDLLCSDSKNSDAVLREVFRAISLTKLRIKFTYNFDPLPYHFYAFKTHQGFQYVNEKLGGLAAQQYIRYIFDNQDKFAEEIWIQKSINQFLDEFSNLISQNFAVDKSQFRLALAPGTTYDYKSRYQWKYSSSSDSISGTPIFYANGVRIDGAEDWKFQDWIEFISLYI